MQQMPQVDELVAAFRSAGVAIPAGRLRIGSYGDSPEVSRELIELIRTGPKRAGTSLLWAYEVEHEELPKVGDIEIVVDHLNAPVLLTRITSVEVVPFNQVTAEYAAIEGEGDKTLAHWREGHWEFFSRACQGMGRAPAEDMPVVCAVFELLAALPQSAA